MPVQRIKASAALVSPAGTTVTTLSVMALTTTQDEGVAPFYTATVTVAMPTAAQFAMMKPGAGYYLALTADPENVTSGAVLLKITDRSRTTEGNVQVQAASAELELQSFTPSAVDRSNWQRQRNVPAIISDVLTKAFGSRWVRYQYSAGDAFGQDIGTPAFPTFQALNNLVPNGSFERGTVLWSTANCSIVQSTDRPHTGAYGAKVQHTSSSSTVSYAALNDLGAAPGRRYTASAWFYLPAALGSTANSEARTIAVTAIRNNVETRIALSPQAANTAGVWQRVAVTFDVPGNATQVRLRLNCGAPAGSNAAVYWDDVLVVEGSGLDTDGVTQVAFFDGDTTDTADYNYDWTDVAGASSSTRTPVVAREPDALTWTPGQFAWSFLQSILQAAGVRFWSTGYAVYGGQVVAMMFWARNDFGFSLAAPRALDGLNLFELSQLDSWSSEFPDGTPMYADQVIIHYVWTDNLHVEQEAYDVYPATGRKPYFLDKQDTPFPGYGRAQGIFNRISARATVYQGTTWFDRGIEPGKQLAITSAKAAGGSVLGYVEAVTHDTSRGTTEFRTKQTVAFTSGSWFTATDTWASQTGSWATDI